MTDARAVALSFAGLFCGGFALAVAVASADAAGAPAALAMVLYCGAEFALCADGAAPS